jgi:hypothetical protein
MSKDSPKSCGNCEHFWPITDSSGKHRKRIQGDCCNLKCPYGNKIVWKSYPACKEWELVKPIDVGDVRIKCLEELGKLENKC